jgi:hypothetical protein
MRIDDPQGQIPVRLDQLPAVVSSRLTILNVVMIV